MYHIHTHLQAGHEVVRETIVQHGTRAVRARVRAMWYRCVSPSSHRQARVHAPRRRQSSRTHATFSCQNVSVVETPCVRAQVARSIGDNEFKDSFDLKPEEQVGGRGCV
jgi:hypothetical protein